MKYEKKDIITLYESQKPLKFIFFWGHSEHPGNITKACLSQWYPCKFIKDNVVYSTAEQYMMAQKALLFQDTDTYDKIMEAEHPKKYQSLGRKVKNFSEAVWNQHKYNIVVEGNLCKFSQNEKLKDFLLGTNSRILVEASPYDAIWGIKMAAEDKNIENPLMWKGENLLGFALMEVRDMLSHSDLSEKQ
ncbi:MAG: NADAR family protein [Lachnospiraceae bacterium]|nr:NADAR family protein [Lachnospiraceae bacterium]